MTSAILPRSVSRIGSMAFGECTSLRAIEVDEANPNFLSREGVLFDHKLEVLLAFPAGRGGQYSIPEDTTAIGRGAFFGCSGLTSVIFPPAVTSIGSSAFANCTKLTNIVLPESLSAISNGTFYNCRSLPQLNIPKRVVYIGQSAFWYCAALTSINIPTGISTLAECSFQRCFSLTNINLPSTLASVGANAFQYCGNLMAITIPAGVTNLGSYGFAACTNLAFLLFLGDPPQLDPLTTFHGTPTLAVYYLPSAVGWGDSFGGRAAELWDPRIELGNSAFGVREEGFAVSIRGTPNLPIVLETAETLKGRGWRALLSCAITNGSLLFKDPDWTNHTSRFYRIRPP